MNAKGRLELLSLMFVLVFSINELPAQRAIPILDLPDEEISRAFERSAKQNILAAINSDIFFGYFSVCADGKGFGYGNTYPSLDGHQMTDALLWLGQTEVVKANWEYVRKFQKPNGQLPLAILPAEAGRMIGPADAQSAVEANGGLYRHWVPGDPLRALAGPTLIQNADVIYRFSQDREWLVQELPAANLAGDYLAFLTSPEGMVAGAGYYIERPARIEYDGVAQCHAVEALRRLARLNQLIGQEQGAKKYQKLADRIQHAFSTHFWQGDQFAEYIHPQRGVIDHHGLTDVDWCAIATGMANPQQKEILWPRLRKENFYYGGMPTGIATMPTAYEKWEFTYPDQMDLAAMGRVWYVEAWARAEMQDAEGLLSSILHVCREGEKSGYYWRERYHEAGGYGAEKYCEYPANLIRIVERFLFGWEWNLDGSLRVQPVVPDRYWQHGFGQTLLLQNGELQIHLHRHQISGSFLSASPLTLSVRLPKDTVAQTWSAKLNDQPIPLKRDGAFLKIQLPKTTSDKSYRFSIQCHDNHQDHPTP